MITYGKRSGPRVSSMLLYGLLKLNDPCISESCVEMKIKLNFYFHTSLWCLKWFYEVLQSPDKFLD